MKSVYLPPSVKKEIGDIWKFIASDNREAALQMKAKIINTCGQLGQFLYLGRPCEEISPKLRRITVSPYLIVYKIHKDSIAIVSVIHSARNWQHHIRDSMKKRS